MEFANAAALRAARRMMFALRKGMTDLGGRGGRPPAWAAALLPGLRRHRRPCRPQPLEFQGRDPAPGSPASFGIAHHGADICPRLHRRWLGGSPRRGAEHDRGLRRPLFRSHGGLVRRGTIGRPGQANLEAHDVAPSSRPVRGDAEPRPTYRLGQMDSQLGLRRLGPPSPLRHGDADGRDPRSADPCLDTARGRRCPRRRGSARRSRPALPGCRRPPPDPCGGHTQPRHRPARDASAACRQPRDPDAGLPRTPSGDDAAPAAPSRTGADCRRPDPALGPRLPPSRLAVSGPAEAGGARRRAGRGSCRPAAPRAGANDQRLPWRSRPTAAPGRSASGRRPSAARSGRGPRPRH